MLQFDLKRNDSMLSFCENLCTCFDIVHVENSLARIQKMKVRLYEAFDWLEIEMKIKNLGIT